ncbi:MAG TPA: hypothetical protein VM077_01715 [Candidatus Limnocylindrales bacterium]|nr:hypothetical protein [Candidatus Limnocylindrales bacterium]
MNERNREGAGGSPINRKRNNLPLLPIGENTPPKLRTRFYINLLGHASRVAHEVRPPRQQKSDIHPI